MFSRPSWMPPSGGPPKVCSAICGNSARGIPSTMARMSTTKVSSSTSRPRRYRRPSTDLRALRAGGPAAASAAAGRPPRPPRSARSRRSGTAGPRPTVGSSTPASSGPSSTPTLNTVMLSAFAPGTSSAGTSRGMIAPRAGLLTANRPCCRASIAKTTTTEPPPTIALTHSPMLVSEMPLDVDDQDATAVVGVGDGAAEQAEGDQRDQRDERRRTDPRRGPGEVEDLLLDGDDGQLRPDDGDGLADEQPLGTRGSPARRVSGGDAGQPQPPAAGLRRDGDDAHGARRSTIQPASVRGTGAGRASGRPGPARTRRCPARRASRPSAAAPGSAARPPRPGRRRTGPRARSRPRSAGDGSRVGSRRRPGSCPAPTTAGWPTRRAGTRADGSASRPRWSPGRRCTTRTADVHLAVQVDPRERQAGDRVVVTDRPTSPRCSWCRR